MHLHVVSFREQSIQVFLAQVTHDLPFPASHYTKQALFLNNFPE